MASVMQRVAAPCPAAMFVIAVTVLPPALIHSAAVRLSGTVPSMSISSNPAAPAMNHIAALTSVMGA